MIKLLIKKITPRFILDFYHLSLAIFAKIIYGNPSSKMTIVGVTGTKGKSSTCYFTSQILESAGKKVGMTSTTLFKVGSDEWLNDKKMTMLGRFQTQKLLSRMVKEGCEIAIIETSSEGIAQFRHIGIDYDMVVFTNLYPEHIDSHGSFEKYKEAKGKLFEHLEKSPKKNKISVVNIEDEHAVYFLGFEVDKKLPYGKKGWQQTWKFNLLGEFNKMNVIAAASVARELGVDEGGIADGVSNLKPLPGRLEFIENDLGMYIIVDYSYDPKAMEKLYETISAIQYEKLIHVLGGTGGGRDKARRPILGKMASDKADHIIITDEDPYDENPEEIMDQVAEKVAKEKLLKILDRKKAIAKAIEIASKGDLILITGKGAEQAMCVAGGKKIAWDDRSIVREELEKL
jgi:UDP-N-acetylmuramoyl-L-alanyl-D-glutamate--2,6-diaminopimelate ligase